MYGVVFLIWHILQDHVSGLKVVLHFLVCMLGTSLTNTLAMHKYNEGCNSLLEKTASTLDEEALQMLLVSAQETNMALCIKYATQW